MPHLAARSIPDRRFLDEKLRRLSDEAGVEEILLIAGAVDTPVGGFSNTMEILETGLVDRSGSARVGVAGYPEGSPDIPDEVVDRALAWKGAFAKRSDAAVYVLTQFCFEAEPVIAWEQRVRAATVFGSSLIWTSAEGRSGRVRRRHVDVRDSNRSDPRAR